MSSSGAYSALGSGFDLVFMGVYSGGGLFGIDLAYSADAGMYVSFGGLKVAEGESFPTGTFALNDLGTLGSGEFFSVEIEVGTVYDDTDSLVSADVIVSSYEDSGSSTIATHGVVSDGTVTVTDDGDSTYKVEWNLTTDADLTMLHCGIAARFERCPPNGSQICRNSLEVL